MCPLAPLVPRIDEDKAVFAKPVVRNRLDADIFQVSLEFLRRRTCQQDAINASARCVVPLGSRSLVTRIGHIKIVPGRIHHRFVCLSVRHTPIPAGRRLVSLARHIEVICGVHAKVVRIGELAHEVPARDHVDVPEACRLGHLTPFRDNRLDVRNDLRPIHHKDWDVLVFSNLDVTRILERDEHIAEQGHHVFASIVLRHDDVIHATIPPARPVLVRPTEAEWEVDVLRNQIVVYRLFKESFPIGEMVIVEAKAVDAVLSGHRRLLPHHVHVRKIIIADVLMRHMRLIMPFEERLRLPDIRPLRKPFPPPLVIFRY